MKKLRELNLTSGSKVPIDAEYYLNDLNATFMRLCEEFMLLSEEEQGNERNRNIYFGAQQTFHSAGTKLIRRIFNPDQEIEEPTENSPLEQVTQEAQKMIEIKGGSSSNEKVVEQEPPSAVQNVQNVQNVPPLNNENAIGEQEQQQSCEDADVVIVHEELVQPVQKDEQMVVDETTETNESSSLKYDDKDGAVGGTQVASTSSAIQPVASASSFVPRAEQSPPMLPYKKFLYMMMPIYGLQSIVIVDENAINAVLRAIEQMQERAQREHFSLEQLQLMIISYVHHLMDHTTQALWLWQIEDSQPTLDMLIGFLVKRSRTVHQTDSAPSSVGAGQASMDAPSHGPGKKKRKVCQLCAEDHYLHRCMQFLGLNVRQRRHFIDTRRLCHNCFSGQHTTAQCTIGPCKLCNLKHNSLVCGRNEHNS